MALHATPTHHHQTGNGSLIENEVNVLSLGPGGQQGVLLESAAPHDVHCSSLRQEECVGAGAGAGGGGGGAGAGGGGAAGAGGVVRGGLYLFKAPL